MGDVSCSERIYISYRQKGWEKLKWGQLWDSTDSARKKCPLLWISCGQKIGKFMCKQQVEALGA